MQLDSVVERQIAKASEDPPELTAINISTFTGCCRMRQQSHVGGDVGKHLVNAATGGDEHPFTSVHFCLFRRNREVDLKHFRRREFSKVGKSQPL